MCSEQSFESACLCWLWGKQRERNHLKTLSVFVTDLLSQGKAENHVMGMRNKPWSPKAKNFTQHGPNTPLWKRWSAWMLWVWGRAYYIFCDWFGGCWGWVSEITWRGGGDIMEILSLSQHCRHHWHILPCRALWGTSALEECPLGPSSRGQTGSG